MTSFHDLPLRRKLTLVIVAACALTVLAACGSMAAYRVYCFRQDFARNLRSLGKLTSEYCAAPLVFGDRAAAQETLAPLAARPDIHSAALQRSDGSLMAALGEPLSPADLARFPRPVGLAASEGELLLAQPIVVDGHVAGRLLLRADYRAELVKFLRAYGLIVGLVIAASVGLAVGLSRYLQRPISEPILHLVRTATHVARHQDYTARVQTSGRAELRLLTETFNQMLARIQEHAETLRRLNLEALHQEIAERRRTEAALRESEERLKLALAASRMGVWDWNLQTNTVFWSPECFPIMGVTEFEGNLEAFTRLVHPQDVARVTEVCRRAIADQSTFTAEFRICRLNGEVAWVSNLARTVYDTEGRPLQMVGILQDITTRKRAELALRDREAELTAIYEHAPLVMLLVDAERRICKMNRCAETFARTTLAEAHGRRGGEALRCLNALHSPEGCGYSPACGSCALRQTVLDTLSTGRSHQQVEATLPFAVNGERRELTFLLGTARLEVQGQPRVLVTLQDITELKQTQEALRQSEAFTRTVLDHLPLGIAVNSVAPAVEFKYINESFLKAYRIRREQLASPDAFWEAAYEDPAFRDQIRKQVLEDCASGNPSRMVWRDVPITRRGEPTTYISARNIPLPDRGLMISTVWDVTERKQAELALRRSEEMFRLITENAAELVALVDAQGRRRYNSPAYQRVLGYNPEELRRTSIYTQIHPEDRDRIAAAIAAAFETGAGQTLEYRMRHADGSWRVLESSSALVRGALEGEDALLVVARDITARKQAEAERAAMQLQLQQAQKLESLGRLAAGIAHEINTPTQYIGDNHRFLQEAFADLRKLFDAYGQLLQAARARGLEPPLVAAVEQTAQSIDAEYLLQEIPTALGQSLEGVERVAQIVRAMKDFSHPGSGEKTAVDLNHALQSTLTICRNEWKYVANVVTDFAPSPPPVRCLPGELNQVFLNLIVNAAQAIAEVVGESRQTKGTITVRTRYDADWFEIQIADTGAGIPEHIRDRIFEPFFTTKPVGKGTGQGLALARAVVVERHGGTLTFESQVGRGTTFVIRLPLNPETTARAEIRSQPAAAAG